MHVLIPDVGAGGWAIARRAERGARDTLAPQVLLFQALEPTDWLRHLFHEDAWLAPVWGGPFQRIFEMALEPTTHCVAELISGTPARALFEAGIEVPPHAVSFLGHQLSAAMADLHGKRSRDGRTLGLLARPTPDTVFLAPDGVRMANPIVVSLANGLATRRTHPSEVDGFSPEELRGPPTFASDVFRLAVVLVGLLQGRSPFGRTTAGEVIHAIRAVEVERGALDRAPAGLRAVLLRALDADPSVRPSPLELAGELERTAGPSSGAPMPIDLSELERRLAGVPREHWR